MQPFGGTVGEGVLVDVTDGVGVSVIVTAGVFVGVGVVLRFA